eukprot:5506618-Pleurochrysis_carterae.AAC.1
MLGGECLVSVEFAAPGLVESIPGVPKAAAFTTVEGGRGGSKVVGVLVGEVNGEKIAGERYFESHHVCVAAFGTPVARTRRGQSERGGLQDRLGFHTFRRGDIVKYSSKLETDPVYKAVVFGTLLPEKKESEQGRKVLILYDSSTSHFFLGQWTEWERVHSVTNPASLEDNETATSLDADAYIKMQE